MKKQIWIPILIIAVVIVGLVIFLPKSKKQVDKEPIKIGAILPLTSKSASLGEDMQKAINLALENINKDKKIVEIFYEDEKCDGKEAVTAYQSLRLKNINIIIGAGCSPSTIAIAPLAEKDKVVVLSPASSADSISQAGDFIFRNHIFVSQKVKKLAEFANKKFNSVATIYDATNDAHVLGEMIFVKNFQGNVLARESFQKNALDFSTQITKIKEKKPMAIFIQALMPEASLIVKRLKELGVSAQILVGDALATDKVFIDAIENFSEGIIFVGSEFSRSTNPEFWDLYTERFGKNPNIYAAQAYDSLIILVDIIKRECKTGNSTCVKDSLYKVKNYLGVSGLTTFDENGDAIKTVAIKTIKNGQFVPYEE